MSSSDEIRATREAIVREHMEAENQLDFERAIETFKHPRYELIGSGQVFDGAEEVAEYFRQSRAAFPDQGNELIAMHHADDAVITEFWLVGTHMGSPPGIAPTGRRIRVQMTSFFLFEGTNLVCERVYFDTATLRRQLTE
jgi:predicted ester cyclase